MVSREISSIWLESEQVVCYQSVAHQPKEARNICLTVHSVNWSRIDQSNRSE